MTEKKQTNLGLFITVALFAAVLVIIIFFCSWCKTPVNADAGDGNFGIVSLAPNVTEMLFALGLADCVIGVTDCCNYPPQAKDKECIGSFGRPNIEKLLALRPKLVIATDFERDDIATMLSESGIEVLELKIHNLQDVFEALRTIGKATEKITEAERIIDAMQAELKAIAEKFEGIEPSHRPKVFVEIWPDPITTVGKASFIDDVITRAGGVNVAGNINQAYPRINPEKVIEWDPDVIILYYMTDQANTSAQLANRIGWADIEAVRKNRIIDDIPPHLILRPGPRLIQGVKLLSQRIYTR